MDRYRLAINEMALFILLMAILAACSAAPPTPIASAPTEVRTVGPAAEPTIEPTVVQEPTAVATVVEQPSAVPTMIEQSTATANVGATPPTDLTWDGAVQTLRAMLAAFEKGEDISGFLSTKLQGELASSRTLDEALGLHALPLTGFEVRDALNEPTEVLLVPATLRYADFEEERLYEMVVEDEQWRVTGSGKVTASGEAATCEPATSEVKGLVNIAPPFCIVWADTFDDEQGFRITLQYLGTGGETFTYEVGPHVTQFAVPEQDRPRTDESAELCAQRGSFSVQVTALRSSGPEVVGGMAMDGECGMGRPEPSATEPSSAATSRMLYIRFDYERQGADLISVATDGSDEQVIFSCVEPCDLTALAVSPVHDEFAFTSHGQGETQSLYIAERDGTVLHRIQGNMLLASQAWSPDGERLAYVQSRATSNASPVETTAIFVVDRLGRSTQVTDWALFTEPPIWQDNERLLFSQATTGTPPTGWRTFRVDVAGNGEVELVTDGEIVDASPDRTQLLVMVETVPNDSTKRVLTLVTLNDGATHTIDGSVDPMAAWAPDGHHFVVFDPQAGGLFKVNARDAKRTELRAFEQTPYIPFAETAWSSDRKELYYTRCDGNQTEVHRYDVASGNDQVIVTYDGEPRPLVLLP